MLTSRLLYHHPKALRGQRPDQEAPAFDLPVTLDGVRTIASSGFPLKENMATLVLRNKRITVAYADLSNQLIELLASTGPEVRAANWCTYASWSSLTIGASIDPDEFADLLEEKLPFRRQLAAVLQRMTRRDHGVMFRSLAAGNRFIFLEIGVAVALFVETFEEFGNRGGAGLATIDTDTVERAWDRYWARLRDVLEELRQLDPSWVRSETGDADLFRVGMRQYLDAFLEPDADLKSERILAANLLLGAYEQYRADGYVETSFAVWGRSAFRRLLITGSGRSRNPFSRLVTSVVTRAITRFGLSVMTPHELLRIGKPLDPPKISKTERRENLFPCEVTEIQLPLLQALLSRYDHSDFHRTKRGARNWLSYNERMHYIANFFRSRHDDALQWEVPVYPPERVEQLRRHHGVAH